MPAAPAAAMADRVKRMMQAVPKVTHTMHIDTSIDYIERYIVLCNSRKTPQSFDVLTSKS
jgi:hypothetical protein